jgi:hypothetical protein
MIFEKLETVEYDVRYVRVCVAVRYGEKDIPNDFPLRSDDMWCGTIDINTGKVLEWPKDKTELHKLSMKVCDEGTYYLQTVDDEFVSVIDGYCPNQLIPGSYGDYIDLQIENGIVTNWYKNPSLIEFERNQ